MAAGPNKQFGKRPPPAEDDARPSKRSGYVALFLMGTVAVGAGAYAMMPSETCEPPKPPPPGVSASAAAAMAAAQNPSCRTSSRSNGYSYGSHWSRRHFFGGSGSSSSHSSSSGGFALPATSTTSRGGFGRFGHAIASSFSRGG